MKWKVRLEGDERGLEDLADSFDDDPEIFEDEGNYFVWSSRFEDLDDAGEVREVAQELVQYIRNFGERDSLWVEELEISHVHEILDDGSEHTYVRAEAATVQVKAGPVRVQPASDEDEGPVHLPADRTQEWTQLALEDDKVAELAELLDQGDDWVNLYRIYEFIQANIESDDNIVAQGWWSQNEKDLFKRTANSREAIGDDARHGQERTEPPRNPISHAEAKRLIDTLIDHWLHHRQNL